jgi:hypothetical protein
MQAIRSASLSELPDFSPNALAQMRQMYFILPLVFFFLYDLVVE